MNPAASGAFTYSYLYFGTRTALLEQLEKDGPFSVVGGVNGSSTQTYHFTLPASAAGTRVPVCILKGDLTGIVRARRLSQATMANIRQNLVFAFIYNAAGVPIAAGVLYPFFGILLSPIIAAAAMALSSVSVIGNALRLNGVRL